MPFVLVTLLIVSCGQKSRAISGGVSFDILDLDLRRTGGLLNKKGSVILITVVFYL